MARAAARFVCQACGAVHGKWSGRCDACGEWNTISEEAPAPSAAPGSKLGRGRALQTAPLKGQTAPVPRRSTGIGELDRVLGDGLAAGAAVLIGGDPGIGKSTLLLQAACALSAEVKTLYVTGEEALDQVRGRAIRLGLGEAPLELLAATRIDDIIATADTPDGARVLVIDSIQTMALDAIDSAPGTVGQVRASAQALIRLAKARGIALFLVGHVTKDGQIAGPRVLEHMVDTVLYFEGERGHHFRILRGVKNRFGRTDEIGVFEMAEKGLIEVPNPSSLFLAERHADLAGAAVFAGVEGTRPVLVEIQALVAPAPPGSARRAVIGWDSGRLAMLLAVLEARCGLRFGGSDVYLNIAGGLRVTEPAADLAAAAALISAATGVPTPPEAVVFGEIGLSGEVRGVARAEARLREAVKLGFSRAIAPAASGPGIAGVEFAGLRHLQSLVERFAREQDRAI